jgi:hypothetical protein
VSLETTAPDLGRLFIGEMGEALFRPPACQHDAIIDSGGVSRGRKMCLLGIPTSREYEMRCERNQKNIFGSDKNLFVAIPTLRTELYRTTAAGFDGKTTAKTCWN